MRKLIKKILNENEWEWAINSKPKWSTYYTSLLNDIKKLPNNLEDVTLKMLEPIWMRLSTTNKLLKKGVGTQEIDTDLAIEYMIDDPWPDKKVLLPDNDAIDIIENLFIRLMRVVEGGTENSNGKKYNDAYMTSQQSIYTSKKLTLITYINGLISQLTLINESEDDFDWAKETNPIQCKDLKGYYFYYGTDPRKFIIGGVSINSGDELKVHYKWYDQHSNKDDWGKMGCDTLIHRVKLGSYNLYDTDDKEVNQRDLAYTDNTFDDDVRKEIWEQGELDWVKETPLVTIGGKNGYPKESVPLGTKVISRVGEVFTIEDITGGHMDFQHVWGREISPAWVGPKNDDDNKNWHNTLWLRRATPKDLNESEDDFDWIKDIEAKLVKGMFLCNRHGNNWEIAGIDERDLGRKIIRFYNDPFNKKVITRKYEEIMEDIEDGRLTICKPRKSVTESDDFDWAKDTKPSRKDKLDFSKERYKTTKNYDGVNIGDKFRPPGSHNIWTVVDKVLRKTRWVSDFYFVTKPKGDSIEIETYWVYIENENGQTTQKVWDKVKNGKGKNFPGSYKPWQKVIESVNESDDEWEWAKTTQPIELENPKDWVGRSFGYGQEIIDDMSDTEIDASYDEEYYTITGIDENDNLTLIKNHPIYGENHDSTTSPRNLRDYISKGSWVWI